LWVPVFVIAARFYASAAYATAMQCLSVRLSRSYSVDVQLISTSGRHTILVFPHQTSQQYSDEDPVNGCSIAGAVGRNCDSEPISGSIACCECQVQYAQLPVFVNGG